MSFTCGMSVLLLMLPGSDPIRAELPLDGDWEFQRVTELTEPPTGGEWSACKVPGYLAGTDYQCAWLRRSFTIPSAMRGQRIKLHFGGVKYNSRIYVNGRHVGGCFGGYEAFDIDVTSAVQFDQPNELVVGCHDWTGVFAPGRVTFPADTAWDATRGVPADKILSPVGGLYGLFGIWDEVLLQTHPAVYVKDVFVKPSVRRHELVIDYMLANESDRDVRTTLRAVVEDGDRAVLEVGAADASIPAGQTVVIRLKQAWPNPPLWSHLDPHLLMLRSELATGDDLQTRFGFREFWVEGDRFYLNGVPINLLATSWWPPHETMDRDTIRQRWEAIKQMGCVAFRTHTQPWPALHYDVADEVGLLMIIEGAVWNDDDTYRIYDPQFWDNYAAHLKSMVAEHKNRPSVVMWSLENEFLGGRLNDASPAKQDLVRMGKLVKSWDPTRPIFFESDGDPDGVADCIGIHYPHEYPDFTCWPNEAYWLREPAQIPHMFLNGADSFAWQHDKPLYLGEFLWIPSSDPSWHTVFFGDEAYRDYNRYRNLAKAESWKMQVLGYRDLQVGGISPWTVIEGGPLDESNPLYQAHQYAYQRVAAYPLDYDSRFYSGQPVARQLAVFNDAMHASNLVLHWKLLSGDRTISADQTQLSLAAGQRTHVSITLPTPTVAQREEVTWKWQLQSDGETVFQDQRQLSVFPQCDLAVSGKLGLYDPEGTTRPILEELGLNLQAIASIDQLPAGLDLLIIGTGSLKDTVSDIPVVGATSSPRESLVEFAARGGRVLVLRQDVYPAGLFDVSLTGKNSTITFAQAKQHPVLAGLGNQDLRFWRGDNLVAKSEVMRPVGGAVSIIVSGSAAGIDSSPLVAQPVGRGCIVFCQMLLTEKCAEEPAAARLLANLLTWLAQYQGTTGTTAVAGSPELVAAIGALGAKCENWGQLPPAGNWPAHRLVILGQAPANLDPLRQYVDRGGNLWLHRLPLEQINQIATDLAIPLEAGPFSGSLSRAEGDDPLLDFITREDLYWLGPHTGISWNETPRAETMTNAVFSKSLAGKETTSYEVEDWQLEGGIVERRAPGVVFATVGQATQMMDFPTTGSYLIGVHARGTPTAGIFPLVRISVDGETVGTIGTSDLWKTTTVQVSLNAGKHAVSVAFINDGSNPPNEDRNLYVDRVVIAPDDPDDGLVFLTTPAALAVARRGKGLIVFDQIAWDTEESNARQANRFAGALLTALGGEFHRRMGTSIEAEKMTPQPGVPHFSNTGSFASMACNGYIATPLRVASAGRYLMEVVASGSAVGGVYPEVAVLIDGRSAGSLQLRTAAWHSYTLSLELEEGEHELRLAFTNDFNRDGEDRNLQLDKVIIYRQ